MKASRIKKGRWMIGLVSARVALAAFCAALLVSNHARAATLFTEDFESYPAGVDWADNTGTNGGWRLLSDPVMYPPGFIPDPGQIVSSPTFTGNRAGNFNPTTTAHIFNWFNKTSGTNIPTPTAWIEFYVMHDFYPNELVQSWGIRVPKTNDSVKTRFQIGFFSFQGDLGQSGELFVSGALLNTTFTGFSLNDGDWAHVVAEVNLVHAPGVASSTAKLYAKQVAAGDTSPLTTDDIMDLGGSDTVNFMWDGSILDALVLQNDFRQGTGVPQTLDNIAVYIGDSPIVSAALDGDLNGDGFVGVDDLNIVLVNWNQNVTPGDLLAGDPTGEGFVGVDDLNIVLVNWNNGTPPAGGAAIPEPASLALFGLGGVAALRRQR